MKNLKHRSSYVLLLVAPGLCFGAAPAALAATANAPAFIVKTTYNGLIYREQGVLPGEAGYFRLDASRKGRFTGKLLVGRQHVGFSGKFNPEGTAYVPVKVGTGRYEIILNPDSSADVREIKKLEWTLVLQLTNGLDEVAGQILSYERAGWSGLVLGERAGYSAPTNPAPQAGRYTVVLPGTPDGQSGPAGAGWGALTVDQAGNVRLLGALSDDSKLTASSVLSADGAWPLFVPSDGGRGMLVGWLKFTNTARSELSGQLIWVRLKHPGVRFYAEGFTNQTSVLASHYVPPASYQAVLNLTNAILVLGRGELGFSITNSLTLRSPTELRGAGGSRVMVKFFLANGLFLGRAQVPGATRTLGFSGAVLQNQNVGFGYFTGDSSNGEVIIEAESLGPS
jgi:hypothetical protein